MIPKPPTERAPEMVPEMIRNWPITLLLIGATGALVLYFWEDIRGAYETLYLRIAYWREARRKR